MDMDDVVRTDAFLGVYALMGVAGLAAGALIVVGVISFPLWVGICGIVGGLGCVNLARRARNLFRARGDQHVA
jgi:hypothetical protein